MAKAEEPEEDHTCDRRGMVGLEIGTRNGIEYTTKIYHCSVCGYVTDSDTTIRRVEEG